MLCEKFVIAVTKLAKAADWLPKVENRLDKLLILFSQVVEFTFI